MKLVIWFTFLAILWTIKSVIIHTGTFVFAVNYLDSHFCFS